MTTIKDVLYIKSVERRLGRKLTEEEMMEEGARVRFPDGHFEFIVVPILQFPEDLLASPQFFPEVELADIINAA